MLEKTDIQLRPFSIKDLDLWDKWKSLADFSIYQTYLLPEGFKKNNVEDYLILIIQSNSDPVGSIWLEEIRTGESAWLGIFIGNPTYWNKGIGSTAIKILLKNAFNKLKLKLIYLKVREENYRAIRCYEKVGFNKYRYHEPEKFKDGSIPGWFEMVIRSEYSQFGR